MCPAAAGGGPTGAGLWRTAGGGAVSEPYVLARERKLPGLAAAGVTGRRPGPVVWA